MTPRMAAVAALIVLFLVSGIARAEETASEKIDRGRKLFSEDKKKATALLREAIAELEKQAAGEPDDYDIQADLGRAFFYLGEDVKALAAFGRASAIDPEKSRPHFFIGLIHRFAENLDESVKAFTRACRLDAKSGDCWYELAQSLRRNEDLEEALAAYQRACSLKPESCQVLFDTGTLLSQMGRDREALDVFLKASNLDPEQSNFSYNAGQSAQNLGLHKQALGHFLTATRLDPDNWRAIAKTIQEYEALGMEEQRDRARKRLYALRKKGTVESLKNANLFIREQFVHDGRKVFVIEYFEMKGDMAKKLSFQVKDPKSGKYLYKVTLGSYEFTNTIAQASGDVSEGNRLWHLDRYVRNGKHTTISFFDGEPPYDVVRSLVIEVLDGKFE